MMAGLLFARAGVRAVVLEKHADFLRDFRGDTVHPSTIDLVDELGLHDLGAPIDVFWFRVPKPRTGENRTQGDLAGGEMMVCIDRGDYFQCARVIEKGSAEAERAKGIAAFRDTVVRTVPALADGIAAIASFDDVKLLSVSLDGLERWRRPGLLAIGDAAHAMSPVGGVGINLAVQDAVAAANVLAGALARGDDADPLLAKVQARRMLAVKVVQGLQRTIHRRVIGAALAGGVDRAPLALRLLDAAPALQRVPARNLGLGVRREHIRSPRPG